MLLQMVGFPGDLWLNNVLVCMYVCVSHFLYCLLMDVSMLCLLQIIPLWTWGCRYLFESVLCFHFLWIYSQKWMVGSYGRSIFIFEKPPYNFSYRLCEFTISSIVHKAFPFLCILTNICYLLAFWWSTPSSWLTIFSSSPSSFLRHIFFLFLSWSFRALHKQPFYKLVKRIDVKVCLQIVVK